LLGGKGSKERRERSASQRTPAKAEAGGKGRSGALSWGWALPIGLYHFQTLGSAQRGDIQRTGKILIDGFSSVLALQIALFAAVPS
jgi:hypothetical protein